MLNAGTLLMIAQMSSIRVVAARAVSMPILCFGAVLTSQSTFKYRAYIIYMDQGSDIVCMDTLSSARRGR
jgi:hypothetical protein